MLDKERELLYSRKSEYLSIGITDGGKRITSIHIPWELTAHAFNMQTPDIYIAPEDLKDKELIDKIKSFHVMGCYAFTALDNYGFIAELNEVRDIYIIDGVNIKDLSFLSELGEWQMLHIESAHLKDLEPIYESSKIGRMFPSFCFSFAGCTVDDASALSKVKRISELIIIG